MTTYYRNEYRFSEIYLQEITQQPEDTEILASLTTLKEYREFARTAAMERPSRIITEWVKEGGLTKK